MTLDDRLRDYAARWNTSTATVDPRATSVADGVRPVPPRARRPRATRPLVAATVAALLVGVGVVAATVADRRRDAAPAAAAPLQPAVDVVTAPGQLIPVGRRVAAIDLTGTLLDGSTWSLADRHGQVTIVAAWASWCGPCQEFAPSLNVLAQPDVAIVGLAVKEPAAATVRQFVTDYSVTYPVMLDDDGSLLASLTSLPLAPAALPVTVLVDREERIAALYLGTNGSADLATAVAELAAEHP